MKNIHITYTSRNLRNEIFAEWTPEILRIFFTTSLGILPPFSSTWCQVPHSRRLLLTSRGVRQFERLDRKKTGRRPEIFKEDPKNTTPPTKKTSENSRFFLGKVFFLRKKNIFLFLNQFHSNLFLGKMIWTKLMFRTFQNAKGFWGNKGWPPFLGPWILKTHLMERRSQNSPNPPG